MWRTVPLILRYMRVHEFGPVLKLGGSYNLRRRRWGEGRGRWAGKDECYPHHILWAPRLSNGPSFVDDCVWRNFYDCHLAVNVVSFVVAGMSRNGLSICTLVACSALYSRHIPNRCIFCGHWQFVFRFLREDICFVVQPASIGISNWMRSACHGTTSWRPADVLLLWVVLWE